MRKLTLKLDDLAVESFETRNAADGTGTVQANSEMDTMRRGQTCNGATDCGTCWPQLTCDGSIECAGDSFDLETC